MSDIEKLAINGGSPAKKGPYSTGKRFGDEELKELKEALEQNSLFYAKGTKVKKLCEEFARMHGMKYCIPSTSGTAAIHVAIGALDIGPGDEVIVPPITDQGTLIGILFQNALPVFCDVLPDSYTYDPKDLERKITKRTKAIIPVHLTGSPNDMDTVLKIARAHKIPVIEDCAQSYLAEYKGKKVGTMGELGCFSLNDFKHISAGDGGMTLTNDDDLAKRCTLFADKWYDRSGDRSKWSMAMLAPNYRMNELTGAVGLAQLKKLSGIVNRRRQIAAVYDKATAEVKGLYGPKPPKGGVSSYWFYMIRIEEKEAKVSRLDFIKAINAEGVPAWGPYVQRVKYLEPMFTELKAYPHSKYPFDNPAYGKVEYKPGLCPNSERLVDTTFIIPVNEFHSDADAEQTAQAIRKVGRYYNMQK